jgi:hypothetical protein
MHEMRSLLTELDHEYLKWEKKCRFYIRAMSDLVSNYSLNRYKQLATCI